MRGIGCFEELGLVPLGAIVITPTTSGAVAAGDKLSKMFVATTTRLPHGTNVVAVKHVLHRVYAEESSVARAVVAMEAVIGILQLQEGDVGLGSLPANGRTAHWVVFCILSISTFLCPPPVGFLRPFEVTALFLAAAHLQVTL